MLPTDSTRVHCIDPETLAAWVDGGLPAPEAAQVETHLASCARCQSILAAFSQTDADAAPVPATVLPFWSRRPVQWAAAALAAAASITMWTMTRSTTSMPMPPLEAPVEMAQAPRVVEPSAPPAPAPEPVAPPMPKAPARTPAPAPRPAAPPPVVVAEPPPPPPVAVPAPPPPVAEMLPPPVAQMPPTSPVMVNRSAAIAARQELSVVTRFPGAERARTPFEVVAMSSQNAPPAATSADVAARQAGRGGGAGRAAMGGAAAFAGTPPRPAARWRVINSMVERSVDMGATWERVTLDPPFVLTAGSAPFQNVCWLIGEDGLVFRSTNGTSFERMTAPDNVHLLTIVATDALRATVAAVDGRFFETSDGGVTWKQR